MRGRRTGNIKIKSKGKGSWEKYKGEEPSREEGEEERKRRARLQDVVGSDAEFVVGLIGQAHLG